MVPVALHIPDGYLGPQTFLLLWLVMLPIWAVAARKVKRTLRKQNLVQALLDRCADAPQELDERKKRAGSHQGHRLHVSILRCRPRSRAYRNCRPSRWICPSRVEKSGRPAIRPEIGSTGLRPMVLGG